MSTASGDGTASKVRPCIHCASPTDKSYRVCPPCLTTRAIESRRAQGLADTITDPAVLSLLTVRVREQEAA